jgi:predicted DNA-binding protein (MmcQ/YjbR family)
MINVEDLRKIALELPATTEDIKWETHLCFNIGGKMYLVTSPDSVPCSASFKVPAEIVAEIVAKEGFSKQPYLARYNWVHVDDISRLSLKEWKSYINQSYQLVLEKLPAKFRKTLQAE